MKPWLLAETKCDCWIEVLAPSELPIFGLTANAASSQRRASAIASSTPIAQGWNRSSSGMSFSRAINAASARPAQGSGAVKRAIDSAASTVAFSAFFEKSEVLA